MSNLKPREQKKMAAGSWAVRVGVWSVVLGTLAVILTFSVKTLPAVMGHPPTWTLRPVGSPFLMCICALALLAIVSGLTALALIRLRLRALWAVAGVLLGTAAILPIRPIHKARPHVDRHSCKSHLRAIWRACDTYAMDYNGLFPDRLSSLYPDYVSSLDIFICRYSWDRISSPQRIDEEGSYAYVKGLTTSDSPNTVVGFCLGYHSFDDEGFYRQYVDGHIEWIRNGDRYDQ